MGSKRERSGHVCMECGALASVAHHIIPHSLGGVRTIPLCDRCHNLVHSGGVGQNHSELSRLGLERARARGEQIGRPHRVIDMVEIERLRVEGKTWAEIRILTGHPENTIFDALRRMGKR
jgi:hypothetical protein